MAFKPERYNTIFLSRPKFNHFEHIYYTLESEKSAFHDSNILYNSNMTVRLFKDISKYCYLYFDPCASVVNDPRVSEILTLTHANRHEFLNFCSNANRETVMKLIDVYGLGEWILTTVFITREMILNSNRAPEWCKSYLAGEKWFNFSRNRNVNIDLVKKYPNVKWNWRELTINKSISILDIFSNQYLEWEMHLVVSRSDFRLEHFKSIPTFDWWSVIDRIDNKEILDYIGNKYLESNRINIPLNHSDTRHLFYNVSDDIAFKLAEKWYNNDKRYFSYKETNIENIMKHHVDPGIDWDYDSIMMHITDPLNPVIFEELIEFLTKRPYIFDESDVYEVLSKLSGNNRLSSFDLLYNVQLRNYIDWRNVSRNNFRNAPTPKWSQYKRDIFQFYRQDLREQCIDIFIVIELGMIELDIIKDDIFGEILN